GGGAGGPERDPPVGQDVEGRDALRHPDRVIELVRQQRDAVPDANAPGALRDRREEHLGSGRVCELRQEVVLDLPDGVVSELIGEHDLLERIVIAAVIAALVVRLLPLGVFAEVELRDRTYYD